MAPKKFRVIISDLSASNLTNSKGESISCDSYIRGDFDSFKLFETKVCKKNNTPSWNNYEISFNYETQYAHKLSKKLFTLELYDKGTFHDSNIGIATIDLQTIASGAVRHDIPLLHKNKLAGRLQLKVVIEELVNI